MGNSTIELGKKRQFSKRYTGARQDGASTVFQQRLLGGTFCLLTSQSTRCLIEKCWGM